MPSVTAEKPTSLLPLELRSSKFLLRWLRPQAFSGASAISFIWMSTSELRHRTVCCVVLVHAVCLTMLILDLAVTVPCCVTGASFAKYLKERLVGKLPEEPASFEYVNCCKNVEDAQKECAYVICV